MKLAAKSSNFMTKIPWRAVETSPAGLWVPSPFRLCLVIIRHKEFEHECYFFLFWAYLGLSLPEQVLIFWGIVLRLHRFITETGVKCTPPAMLADGLGRKLRVYLSSDSFSVLYSRFVDFNEGSALKSTEMS